jgi:hypothetical protein
MLDLPYRTLAGTYLGMDLRVQFAGLQVNEISSSRKSMSNKFPLLGFLSEPGMFDPMETWAEFLAEVQAMPETGLS